MYARIETSERHEELTDAELVRRFQAGNDSAFEELLRRHSDALYRFCRHLSGDPHDAEDICQETVARAFTRIGSLQSGSAFRSWLFSVARNLAIDSHRAKRKTCPIPEGEAVPAPLRSDEPFDGIELHEEQQTVAEALANLADSHQRVLVLREVDGLSYADIAEELNVSHSAVETLLFRARRRLREEYGKVGVTALVGSFRDIAGRVLVPASAPAALKLSVSAAVVGTTLLAAPHVAPLHRLIPLPQRSARHSSLASRRNEVPTPSNVTAGGVSVQAHVSRPRSFDASPHHRSRRHHRVRVSSRVTGTHHARHHSFTHHPQAKRTQLSRTHHRKVLKTVATHPPVAASTSPIPTVVYTAPANPTVVPTVPTAPPASTFVRSQPPSAKGGQPEGVTRPAPQSTPVSTSPPQHRQGGDRAKSPGSTAPGSSSPNSSTIPGGRHSQRSENDTAPVPPTPASTTPPAAAPTEAAPAATSSVGPGKSGQAPGHSGGNPGHGG